MTYRKVLAAVNEFSNSEIAARYALALSKTCHAKLFLAFIAEENIHKDKLRHAEAALERLFIEAESNGIEVENIIESGEPVKNITALVREHNVDIVFAATRREDVMKRFFIKTLSRQLMMKLPCSVAMVRVVKMGGLHLKNILVPLRGRLTDLEERAYFTARLAEGFNSPVTLFHLHKPITGFFHGELYLTPFQREQRIPKDVEEFREHLNRYKIPHEKKTGHGRIARAITVEAAHKRNDLVVMGASERTLLSSLMKGNPVEEVLRETPCNLIIFRARKKGAL
ncbi:MAG: universal stress protein [Nitrospiraceae bacterium]|nr:MAG: universal stress protein [Nitrospiraceae bacterium]